MWTYEEAVDFIDHIGKYGAHPGIENSARMLEVLGHPERGLKIIHVAGTNGKGSVCAFLADMLTAQGYRTGLFVSPHLVDIRERIQLDREIIGKTAFATCFDLVRNAAESLEEKGYTGITYFDYLFAVALCWYQQQAVDYVVLETGLGGRMDSTNAVKNPILTIITSISLDHTEILGDTIAKIAAEKAGIIKPNVPLIYCADEPDACAVITKTACEMAAPCVGVGRRHCRVVNASFLVADASPATVDSDNTIVSRTTPNFADAINSHTTPDSVASVSSCATTDSVALIRSHRLEFSFRLPAAECAALLGGCSGNDSLSTTFSPDSISCGSSRGSLHGSSTDGIRETLTVNSPALYQAENAAIAYTAALWIALLDKPTGKVPESLRATLRRALSRSVWEGRFEEVLPNVYLDGAHNADGIRMLLASLREVATNRAITLVFTAVKEKDTAEMIREVCESGLFCRYLVTTVGGARAIPPEELAALFLAYTNAPVTTFACPQEAFAVGLKEVEGSEQPGEILLCAGSLYLVGIIKELLSSSD